jgi:hypothetical protein
MPRRCASYRLTYPCHRTPVDLTSLKDFDSLFLDFGGFLLDYNLLLAHALYGDLALRVVVSHDCGLVFSFFLVANHGT